MRLRRAVYYIPHKTDSRKGRRGTMTAAAFFELFHQYGLLLVCGVIFCEYMNLPGFPAGVIMPCIGVLIGEPIMEKLFGKSRKFRSFVQKCHEFIDAQHGRGLALCRIIPMLRTIVSIPAGLIRMPVKWFVGWSAIGIAAWNTALISAGYLFSDRILTLVM